MKTPLDPFDRKILEFVQRDCQLNAEVIAEAVGLSASAVQRRLRRMRTDKVITAEVAVIDPQAVGPLMRFIVGIELKDNYDALPRIRAWIHNEPAVQQLYYVTGGVDLVMIVVAKTVQEYDALAARLMADIPHVIRMTTQVVIDAMKANLYIPVE